MLWNWCSPPLGKPGAYQKNDTSASGHVPPAGPAQDLGTFWRLPFRSKNIYASKFVPLANPLNSRQTSYIGQQRTDRMLW